MDDSNLNWEQPQRHIKTLDVAQIPRRIFDGMKRYEDASRGFYLTAFEHRQPNTTSSDTFLFRHRPTDSSVDQIYRASADPTAQEVERLTYFDIGAGRTFESIVPIKGDDWRGRFRQGGAILAFDLNGNEKFQLFRYWEDEGTNPFPKTRSELDNSPGRGRIERLTHDVHKYAGVELSTSNKIIAYASTKLNARDSLIYVAPLTGMKLTSQDLPAKLITPPSSDSSTLRYSVRSISVDDRFILLTKAVGSRHLQLYIVDITAEEPQPKPVHLPGTSESIDNTQVTSAVFSKDPNSAHLVYAISNGYGDFRSVVIWDSLADNVTHVTTPNQPSLRPIRWDAISLAVTDVAIYWRQNDEGWTHVYVMPLVGASKNRVIEVKPNWEGGTVTFTTNQKNGKPYELLVRLHSHRTQGSLAKIDLQDQLAKPHADEDGHYFVSVDLQPYKQATTPPLDFHTHSAVLRKYKSFDGLQVPYMYYAPVKAKAKAPVIISIHGGPESQVGSEGRIPIHWYLINELGCAVLYPNVRGSIGYGKHYLSLDDVEKREDSVKDIGALIDHVKADESGDLDGDRIAVMGGSYGGYMVYASFVHFSDKLLCGVANFGISHFPSFLRNTDVSRRDFRRSKYGDERVPEVLEMLERISPLNNLDKIRIPLSIAHGESDTRVTIHESVEMWKHLKRMGVHVELIACENEGHGFKQKHVIEFVNAAKIRFLETYFLGNAH